MEKHFMKYSRKSLYLCLFVLAAAALVLAGEKPAKPQKDPYVFTSVIQLKTTPVKNQAATGTCWSFATTSFVESELIRMGKEEVVLAPMINARFAYPLKATNFVRYNGLANFGPGGQAHDVIRAIREYGFVPEDAYRAMNIDEDKHNHGEMDAVLRGMLDAVVARRGRKVTPVWPAAVNSVLDVYLGPLPAQFTYKGASYAPKSFVQSMGFNPDDYVEFTSFSHHPFNAKFDLEVPDNWSKDLYWNVPIEDLMKITDYALEKGFTVAWDGDVSEKSFDSKTCIATVPLDDEFDPTSDKGKEELAKGPIPEKTITQPMRQATFDNQTTSDDHLMHITGLARDQNGAKYYYTKNSWGTKDKKYGGYWYMSDPYVRLKTIAIMVHKSAIPPDIRAKLSI
jgi:bleomycin hydrolase